MSRILLAWMNSTSIVTNAMRRIVLTLRSWLMLLMVVMYCLERFAEGVG